MKTCTKCGLDKEIIEFTKSSKTKDGLNRHCTLCTRAAYKVRYKETVVYKIPIQYNLEILDGEIWKDIVGFESYQISNFGRVYSKLLHNSQIGTLKSTRRLSWGYPTVGLRKMGEPKKIYPFRVHVLVANAFLEKIYDDKTIINHINSNKRDSHISNLEWVNTRENTSHAYLSKKTSTYIGVQFSKKCKNWKSTMHVNKKVLHLGYFKTEKEAAIRYIEALKQYGIENKYAVV